MTTIAELQQLAVDLEYRDQQERQAPNNDPDALRAQINAIRRHRDSSMAA